jgi:hypothetical protein
MQQFQPRNPASYSACRRFKPRFGNKSILTKINRGLSQSLQANVEVKGKTVSVQAWTVPGGSSFQISRKFANEGGKVVSPTHRSPLAPRKYSWYSLL